MIELALTILAGAFLLWLGVLLFFGAVSVVVAPFVGVKEWLDKRALSDRIAASDREWEADMAGVSPEERADIEAEIKEWNG